MAQYENGRTWLSKRQDAALDEAYDMVAFMSEALRLKTADLHIDSSPFVDGLCAMMQEVEKRLAIIIHEDEDDIVDRQTRAA